jgi:hypothetical protein
VWSLQEGSPAPPLPHPHSLDLSAFHAWHEMVLASLATCAIVNAPVNRRKKPCVKREEKEAETPPESHGTPVTS